MHRNKRRKKPTATEHNTMSKCWNLSGSQVHKRRIESSWFQVDLNRATGRLCQEFCFPSTMHQLCNETVKIFESIVMSLLSAIGAAVGRHCMRRDKTTRQSRLGLYVCMRCRFRLILAGVWQRWCCTMCWSGEAMKKCAFNAAAHNMRARAHSAKLLLWGLMPFMWLDWDLMHMMD